MGLILVIIDAGLILSSMYPRKVTDRHLQTIHRRHNCYTPCSYYHRPTVAVLLTTMSPPMRLQRHGCTTFMNSFIHRRNDPPQVLLSLTKKTHLSALPTTIYNRYHRGFFHVSHSHLFYNFSRICIHIQVMMM